MTDLQERLRRFADEGARQARPPGAEAALRRGRRRRRRLVGAAGLALVAVLAAGLGIQGLLEPLSVQPVAPGPPPTTLSERCKLGGCVRQTASGFEPVPGKVIAQGTRPGYRWRLVVRREQLPDHQRKIVSLFQRDDIYSPGADLVTLEPVTLSLLSPSTRDRDPVVSGIVDRRAARIRLSLKRDGTQLSPVDVQPIDGGRQFPERFFVAFVPQGSLLRDVVLLDRQGQPICHQRFSRTAGFDNYPVKEAGSCF
jgi:hypothetical protein